MSMKGKKERNTVSTCCPLLLGVGKRHPMMSGRPFLPDNTPTPQGGFLPRQQGELLCPGGMCSMTHRLLSPTLDAQWFTHTCTHKQPHAAAVHRSYVVQTHTHIHTNTLCISGYTVQRMHKKWAARRMWGRDDGDVARQLISQHSSDPGNACCWLNQWQY